MRDADWDRTAVIGRVADRIWLHVTHLARSERDVALAAAALLQIPVEDVRRLARVHFVLSEPVRRLIDEMPELSRRLRTVTTNELEVADGRLRGAVRWGETISRRAASGAPHLYVTAPARRAFATPENQLLKFALDAIARLGRETRWHRQVKRGLAVTVTRNVTEAERWLRLGALAEVPGELPEPKAIARVRAGRRRREYATVLDVVDLHQSWIERLDREAVKAAVEQHALVTTEDPTLLELCCAFDTIAELEALGWERESTELFASGLVFRGRRGGHVLDVYYQRLPPAMREATRYCSLLDEHGVASVRSLRPDLVLHRRGPDGERWLLVEAKLWRDNLASAAREAVKDLLCYRRDFGAAMNGGAEPYGLAYAWGVELEPRAGTEIMLCTPDTLRDALAAWDVAAAVA